MIDAILDPSVFSQSHRFAIFSELATQHQDRLNIFLPSVFFRTDQLTQEEISSIMSYFRMPFQKADLYSDLLFPRMAGDEIFKNVRHAEGFEEKFEHHLFILDQLRQVVPSKIVYEILAEEWVFMNEYSYIVSRTKRGFSAFMRAGASYLMVGKRQMNWLMHAAGYGGAVVANKALKRPLDSPLDAFSIFRASCKYVAAGGASIGTTIIPGELGIVAGLSGGLFLIMDP